MTVCGSTFEGEHCRLDAEHPQAGIAHIDRHGRRWPSHVAAPGGLCIPDPTEVRS